MINDNENEMINDNEMIKCSDRNMIKHLRTLFNNIMESGYYPISWNQGLFCSIYKSGKKDDPKTTEL